MIGTDLAKAKDILESGGLVAIPTETVYGLGANGYSSKAVLKVFKAKERPFFDPLILHFSSINEMGEAVSNFPKNAKKLAKEFWPGPLTLVLPKKPMVPDEVTSGLNSVAVRIPRHPLTLKLLESLNFPLAAPSANPFGYISPTSASHVEEQLGEKIDYILDGGDCTVGVESTIVSFLDPKPVILREGGVPREKIEAIIGKVEASSSGGSKPLAPGMMDSHYAPRVKLTLVDDLKNYILKNDLIEGCGLLCFKDAIAHKSAVRCVVLSQNGKVEEAASNLFRVLRSFDTNKVSHIYAEMVPNDGIGRAVNDRLLRASV